MLLWTKKNPHYTIKIFIFLFLFFDFLIFDFFNFDFDFLLLTLSNYMIAEIEVRMCNCRENCLKRTSTGPREGVRFRRRPL